MTNKIKADKQKNGTKDLFIITRPKTTAETAATQATLEARIAALEAQVTDLKAQVAALQKK